MKTLISPHWIPTHRGEIAGRQDAQWFAEMTSPWVKIVSVDETAPYVEDVPQHSKIVVRNHPLSENYGQRGFVRALAPGGGRELLSREQYEAKAQDYWSTHAVRPPIVREKDVRRVRAVAAATATDARWCGQRDAETHARTRDALTARGYANDRLWFEGLNEPNVWSIEPPALLAEYEDARLEGALRYGLWGLVAWNLGVGWWGNGGKADAPPDFSPMAGWAQKRRKGRDLYGAHEYWALKGPGENWGWWAGRTIRCPYAVEILITECGVDLGVLGPATARGGWADTLPNESWDFRAQRYAEDLLWYDDRLIADGRVLGACLFTYDIGSPDWERFDVRLQVFLEAFVPRVQARPEIVLQPGTPDPDPGVPPNEAPEAKIRNQAWNLAGIPYNPEAAFAKYASKSGIGRPVTPEYDVDGWRAQGYDGAILYCAIGDWGNIREMPWS